MDKRMLIRNTSSVCPVCLKKISASVERIEGREGVWLCKSCSEHGYFEAPVWKDRVDLEDWTSGERPMPKEAEAFCTADCQSCSKHLQECCCCILEVTKACNLHCTYCFANGGDEPLFPKAGELKHAIDIIAEKGNEPLLQLSGGEPCLRDDLPELVSYAKEKGYLFVQINTNGIRLAEDEDFVKRLADADLDIVFMQFDGTDDEVYRALRGRDLFETKKRAIDNCEKYGLSVTLVPTVVKGINDKKLGDTLRYALERFPAVRAVHYQPVTYLGRYPSYDEKITLDELMDELCKETGLDPVSLLPSRCDHALCEFHGTYIVGDDKKLRATSSRKHFEKDKRSTAKENRTFVAEHWSGKSSDPAKREGKDDIKLKSAASFEGGSVMAEDPADIEAMDFDSFIFAMRQRTMTVSSMAFQDAMDLDLERLTRCSLLVYENEKLLPFCGKYLTPACGKEEIWI